MEGYTINITKKKKIIINVVYSAGVCIAIFLAVVSLFGPQEPMNPLAMIPFSRREQAFIGLAVGAVPMLLACAAACKINNVASKPHKKRNFIAIFLPGLMCAACLLFVVGVILIGMVKGFLLLG